MKKVILLIIAILGISTLVAAFALGSEQIEEPLQISEQEYDWGIINFNEHAIAEIEVTNQGNQSVEILGINTSCSCTKVETDKGSNEFSLEAGDTVKLTVDFDPNFHEDQPPGDIIREVYIKTDVETQNEVKIRLVGELVR